jgi:16S rRNA (cytosine1402-N4)-methyltransferase
VNSFQHSPVMLAEVLSALRPQDGGTYVDGTLGGAGHAAAMLEASRPTGRLYGSDRDGAAVAAATERLSERFPGSFEVRRARFSELADWVPHGTCDGVLLDLGVSSPQLDRAERGFSFQADGPLDMRMDDRDPVSAADLVNDLPVEELATIFWKFGDERESRRFARAIEQDRQTRKFRTTRDLAGLIERLSPRAGKKAHPATKVFQALRIAVNDELREVERGLVGALKILKPGGRLAVITFHSLEDRLVKLFGQRLARDYDVSGDVDVPELRVSRPPVVRLVQRKPVLAGAAELAGNPRARSAQLRVIEKL